MGSRANLVVVSDRRVELYYSNSAATTLLWDLCRGPEDALTFVRAHRRRDPAAPQEWLNPVWCDGAALIDFDQHLVAVAGCEEELVERRLLFELYRVTWPGWQVAWLPEKLYSVSDWLGRPRAGLYGWEEDEPDRDTDLLRQRWSTPSPDPTVLASVRVQGRICSWAFDGLLEHELEEGPEAFGEFAEIPHDARSYPIEPFGGIHVDLDDRTVALWHGLSFSGDPDRIVERWWPGFQLRRWYDDWTRHNAVLGTELIALTIDLPALRADLERRLRQERDPDPVARIAAELAAGINGTVSPAVADPTLVEHLAAFDEILARPGLPGPVPVIAPGTRPTRQP